MCSKRPKRRVRAPPSVTMSLLACVSSSPHRTPTSADGSMLDASEAGDTVVVELGASGTSFLVSGTGTQNISPTVVCTDPEGVVRTAGDDSLPDDCDLDPTYTVTASWDAGQAVEVRRSHRIAVTRSP
eukprot:3906995-Prymnesium_polylepis.1